MGTAVLGMIKESTPWQRWGLSCEAVALHQAYEGWS